MVTKKDLPWLGELLYQECESVRRGGLTVDWSPLEAHEFLGRIWKRRDYHIEVIRESGDKIVAVCGVSLIRPVLPPYPLTCLEWLWWGATKKDIALVWARCKQWGKLQGAEYAQYALKQPQVNCKKFVETYQWVRL